MKTLSTTWPWAKLPRPLSIERVIQEALTLNCDDLCMRATTGGYLYGVGPVTKLAWKGRTQFDLEKAAKAAGLTTSIWCAVSLKDWANEALAIKKAVDYYNPPVVWLDAEAAAKRNIANLGAFLRALGRLGTRVVAVQSYRRADLHREMQWRKWYAYKDADGRFIIDGLGHQLYPLGSHGAANWISDYKKSLDSHQVECLAAGRPDMPWYPTLPAFKGGGYEGQPVPWIPQPDEFLLSLRWLVDTLGARLKRVNFWSLDQDLVDMPDLAKASAELELAPAPPPPAPLTLEQRVTALEVLHPMGTH